MSVTRYSRDVRLEDLNNVHTFAVAQVPPGSRVLDLGAGDGSVARALRTRRCDVTAVEVDADGVAALQALGVRTLHADIERPGLRDVPGGPFDVVLLLDVLEHLTDPAALLSRVPGWLAPGGRVFVSVPNVTHAAVRLALLQGRFPRTDIGLLDRTHVQFFDRAQLDGLLSGAGLTPLSVLTVERDVHETEIDLDVDAIPSEVLAHATADPLSRVYQFFVVARPAVGGDGAAQGDLTQAFQARLRETEAAYRRLERHASQVDAELLLVREDRDRLVARVRGVESAPRDRATHPPADDTAHPADVVDDRDMLRQQLRDRMQELRQAADTIAVLQREVATHRGFAESLASQVPRIAARGGEQRVIAELEAYQAVAPTPAAAAAIAAEAVAWRGLQDAIAVRAIARADAWLRRMPRVRSALRAVARSAVAATRRRHPRRPPDA